MHGILVAVMGFAVLVWFIVRQVTPRRPLRLRFYIMPMIALVVAAANLPHPIPGIQAWDAVISLAISIPFGIMQAHFTTLYQQDGVWYMKGDWRYVASWAALFALKFATAWMMGSSLHQSFQSVEWIVALEVAVVWGLRSLVLHQRYPQLAQILVRSGAR